MAAKGKWDVWLEPQNLALLRGWARDGNTDEQIAKKMGISVRTLYRWYNIPECQPLCQAIKSGKEVTDYAVEGALLKNALEGNVTAQIFWLKNRKPHKWKDKQVQDITEDINKISETLIRIKQVAEQADNNE